MIVQAVAEAAGASTMFISGCQTCLYIYLYIYLYVVTQKGNNINVVINFYRPSKEIIDVVFTETDL